MLFARFITERAFQGWSKKRFTGMNVSWYYTDSEGKNIDIVPEPIHINEEGNRILFALTKLVNKHCEILVSCSDKERNCIQTHEIACKLMELHASFWNLMYAH